MQIYKAAFRTVFQTYVRAEIADQFTRNEIMTANEIRQKIGMRPSNDPKADKLVNSNISQPTDQPTENTEKGGEIQNG